MSPEERELLDRSVALGEENNKMLRSMRNSMRIARIMSFLYWVLIIGVSVGAFYFLQPYMEKVTGLYNSAAGMFSNVNNIKQ